MLLATYYLPRIYSQVNNFFIFPGMSFGAISCHAKTQTLALAPTSAQAPTLTPTPTPTPTPALTRCHAKTIPESFFMVAAEAVAQSLDAHDLEVHSLTLQPLTAP